MDRVFLNANVLFSAAYGSPRISTLWDRARSGRCRLLASRYAIEEARRNLGNPAHLAALARFLEEVAVVDEPPSGLRRPIVFLAALAGVRIQTPATYLGGSA